MKHWFAAKRYGVGWSFPVTWQGWVTLFIYVGLLVAGLLGFSSPQSRLLHVVILSGLLIAVVVWKGERPTH
jgi:Gpi18-like mannosyltransferase